jgi:hypothetical protein
MRSAGGGPGPVSDDDACGCYVAGLNNVGGDHAEICLLGLSDERAEYWREAHGSLSAEVEALRARERALVEALERLGTAAARFLLTLDDYDFDGPIPGQGEAAVLDDAIGKAREILDKDEGR